MRRSAARRAVDVEVAFVLGEVAFSMRLVEDAPVARRDVQGVRQALEDEIAVLRAVAVPSQCGQREGVGGVVGQVESAFEREQVAVRVAKPAFS